MSEVDPWILIADIRWPGVQPCPKCWGRRIGFVETRNLFRCLDCRHEFQLLTGTIFQNSKVSCEAIVAGARAYCERSGRGSVAHLARAARVSYKTALVMSRKFSEAAARAKLSSPGPGELVLACVLCEPSKQHVGYWQRDIKTSAYPEG